MYMSWKLLIYIADCTMKIKQQISKVISQIIFYKEGTNALDS